MDLSLIQLCHQTADPRGQDSASPELWGVGGLMMRAFGGRGEQTCRGPWGSGLSSRLGVSGAPGNGAVEGRLGVDWAVMCTEGDFPMGWVCWRPGLAGELGVPVDQGSCGKRVGSRQGQRRGVGGAQDCLCCMESHFCLSCLSCLPYLAYPTWPPRPGALADIQLDCSLPQGPPASVAPNGGFLVGGTLDPGT